MSESSNRSLETKASRCKVQIGLAITCDFQRCGDQVDICFAADQSHKLLIVFKCMAERHGRNFDWLTEVVEAW